MPRRNKQVRPKSISGGYAAIPWSVMDSVSLKGASDKAKSLLIALMHQHNDNNNGHLHLAIQWLYKQGWGCHENNATAGSELIKRGLIMQTKWASLYLGFDLTSKEHK